MIVTKVQWFNGEPASSVLFPVISACGVRLLFHLQTKNAELRGQDVSMQDLTTQTEIKFQIRRTRPRRMDVETGDLEEVESGPSSSRLSGPPAPWQVEER